MVKLDKLSIYDVALAFILMAVTMGSSRPAVAAGHARGSAPPMTLHSNLALPAVSNPVNPASVTKQRTGVDMTTTKPTAAAKMPAKPASSTSCTSTACTQELQELEEQPATPPPQFKQPEPATIPDNPVQSSTTPEPAPTEQTIFASSGGTARRDSIPGGGATLADCMALWATDTHMTKSEWKTTCVRTLNGTDLYPEMASHTQPSPSKQQHASRRHHKPARDFALYRGTE